MNLQRAQSSCQQRFLSCFRQRLREIIAGQRLAAEAFGPAWEQALTEVPLAEEDQATAYRDLIEEVRTGDIYTGSQERELLNAWRTTVHDF